MTLWGTLKVRLAEEFANAETHGALDMPTGLAIAGKTLTDSCWYFTFDDGKPANPVSRSGYVWLEGDKKTGDIELRYVFQEEDGPSRGQAHARIRLYYGN